MPAALRLGSPIAVSILLVLAGPESEQPRLDVGAVPGVEVRIRLEGRDHDERALGERRRRLPVGPRHHGVVEVDDGRGEELLDERASARVEERVREDDRLERALVIGTHRRPPMRPVAPQTGARGSD